MSDQCKLSYVEETSFGVTPADAQKTLFRSKCSVKFEDHRCEEMEPGWLRRFLDRVDEVRDPT